MILFSILEQLRYRDVSVWATTTVYPWLVSCISGTKSILFQEYYFTWLWPHNRIILLFGTSLPLTKGIKVGQAEEGRGEGRWHFCCVPGFFYFIFTRALGYSLSLSEEEIEVQARLKLSKLPMFKQPESSRGGIQIQVCWVSKCMLLGWYCVLHNEKSLGLQHHFS